eukprot:2210917-Prymnesium_polylepis.1
MRCAHAGVCMRRAACGVPHAACACMVHARTARHANDHIARSDRRAETVPIGGAAGDDRTDGGLPRAQLDLKAEGACGG